MRNLSSSYSWPNTSFQADTSQQNSEDLYTWLQIALFNNFVALWSSSVFFASLKDSLLCDIDIRAEFGPCICHWSVFKEQRLPGYGDSRERLGHQWHGAVSWLSPAKCVRVYFRALWLIDLPRHVWVRTQGSRRSSYSKKLTDGANRATASRK